VKRVQIGLFWWCFSEIAHFNVRHCKGSETNTKDDGDLRELVKQHGVQINKLQESMDTIVGLLQNPAATERRSSDGQAFGQQP